MLWIIAHRRNVGNDAGAGKQDPPKETLARYKRNSCQQWMHLLRLLLMGAVVHPIKKLQTLVLPFEAVRKCSIWGQL